MSYPASSPPEEITLQELRELAAIIGKVREKDLPAKPLLEGRFMLVREREVVKVYRCDWVATVDIR